MKPEMFSLITKGLLRSLPTTAKRELRAWLVNHLQIIGKGEGDGHRQAIRALEEFDQIFDYSAADDRNGHIGARGKG